MRDDDGLDAGDRKLLHDIDTHGWHVLKILASEKLPPFAYSVGIYHTLKHPEIVVIGMDLKLMHWIINEVGAWLKNGVQIELDRPYSGLLEGYDCVFRRSLGASIGSISDTHVGSTGMMHSRSCNAYGLTSKGGGHWGADFNPEWKPMQPLLQ